MEGRRQERDDMTGEASDGAEHMQTADGEVAIHRLDSTDADLQRLPHTLKILLENLLRRTGSRDVRDEDVAALARWPAEPPPEAAVAFMPARVLMQDFTGVPAVV